MLHIDYAYIIPDLLHMIGRVSEKIFNLVLNSIRAIPFEILRGGGLETKNKNVLVAFA